MPVRVDEDGSLHRWGRNLQTISPALDELATAARQHDDVVGGVVAAITKLVTQAETELPADPALTAEIEGILADLRRVQADSPAGRLRDLAGRAEALTTIYRRSHEVDEARLAGERGSRAREKRADVGVAEQDT